MKYWGLGNEMDGYWQMGHRSASDYAAFALEAAKLAKLTDPASEIDRGRRHPISAPDRTGSAGTAPCWTPSRTMPIIISLHLYVGNAGQ